MRLVLLGSPVGHSLSPALHTAALAAVGIDGSYTARDVDAAGVEAAVRELRRGRLDGANVTMPHKRLAARLVDRLEGPAARARSANTLYREGKAVVGANTDVVGVQAAWAEAGLPAEGPVLVLGAGGAAAAGVLALEGRPLRLAARRAGAAARLLAELEVPGRVAPFGEPWAGAVVVNATPIGMTGEALPAGLVESSTGLLDMAYGGSVTPAVRLARAGGIPVADGLDMLVAQAAASFELWTGRAAPMAAMRSAVAARPPV